MSDNSILQISLKGILYVCLCETFPNEDIDEKIQMFSERFQARTGGLLDKYWVEEILPNFIKESKNNDAE